ncbi:MAG: hypothetical protein ACFB5Z_19200 [Elainellaceae cyanobacterium]
MRSRRQRTRPSHKRAQAKAHFEQGKFREADAVLNVAEMGQDLERLMEREAQLDQEKTAIAKSRS